MLRWFGPPRIPKIQKCRIVTNKLSKIEKKKNHSAFTEAERSMVKISENATRIVRNWNVRNLAEHSNWCEPGPKIQMSRSRIKFYRWSFAQAYFVGRAGDTSPDKRAIQNIINWLKNIWYVVVWNLPARTFTSREIIEPNWFFARHA